MMNKCNWTLTAWMIAAMMAGPVWSQDGAGREPGFLVQTPSRQIVCGGVSIPATVVIHNTESQYSGIIEAWIGGRDEAHVCRRAFAVGKGTFRFFLYPQVRDTDSDSQLTVRIVAQGGRAGIDYPVPLRRVQADWSVLAIIGKNRILGNREFAPLQTAVAPLRQVELLPDQWHGYRMFNAVFWDGLVTTPLEPAQKKALADWIRSGGTLILAAKTGDPTVHSPLPELVPDLHLTESVVDGKPAIAASELAGPRTAPFAVKQVGLGRMAFVQTDFNAMTEWPEAAKRSLLNGWPEMKVPKAVREEVHNGDSSLHNPWRVFQPMLARMAGYTALNFTPILITMILYILVVSVVDYAVLKKMKKLPWTWITFPAIIAFFSVYSFFSFYKGRIGELVRHEALYQDVAKDGSSRFKTWACIRNNSNKPIRFAADEAHFIMSANIESQTYSGYPNYGSSSYGSPYGRRGPGERDPRGSGEDTAGRGTKEVVIPGYVGSYRFFEEEWMDHEAAPPFTARLRATARGLEGQLVKGTRKPTAAATFILYHDGIHAIDNDLRVSKFAQGIDASQRDPVPSLAHYEPDQHGRDPVTALATHARFLAIAAPAVDQKGPSGNDPPFGPTQRTDLAVLRRADRNEAVVFAFFREQTKYGSMPVNRITCVRQVVEVATEETAHD